MVNEFDKKDELLDDSQLEDLLADTADEKERGMLKKAWAALGKLGGREPIAPPKPSAELERIFQGEDGRMSDDDLNMVAAAGMIGDGRDNNLTGADGNDIMLGNGGDDTMSGEGGADYMMGGDGDDTMHGGEGSDYLSGGAGNDILDGGAGGDIIAGGTGNDVMTGGAGGDVFLFGMDTGEDVVTDFNPEEDSLVLGGATSMDDFIVNTDSGNTVITFGDSVITLNGVSLTAEQIWAMQGS